MGPGGAWRGRLSRFRACEEGSVPHSSPALLTKTHQSEPAYAHSRCHPSRSGCSQVVDVDAFLAQTDAANFVRSRLAQPEPHDARLSAAPTRLTNTTPRRPTLAANPCRGSRRRHSEARTFGRGLLRQEDAGVGQRSRMHPEPSERRGRSRGGLFGSGDGRYGPSDYSIGISKRAIMPGSPPLASSLGFGSRVATHAYPCSG